MVLGGLVRLGLSPSHTVVTRKAPQMGRILVTWDKRDPSASPVIPGVWFELRHVEQALAYP